MRITISLAIQYALKPIKAPFKVTEVKHVHDNSMVKCIYMAMNYLNTSQIVCGLCIYLHQTHIHVSVRIYIKLFLY